jgi:hypothetical protein
VASSFEEPVPREWWRSPMALAVGLGALVIVVGILLWPSTSRPGGRNQVTSASEPVRGGAVTAPAVSSPAPVTVATKNPASSTPAPAAPAPKLSPGAMRVELVASEPSWISIRGGDGATQMAGMVEPGNIRIVDIRQPAVLRAGNAGGLTIRANGKSMGSLGPHGAIRDVEFKNGEFKLVPVK